MLTQFSQDYVSTIGIDFGVKGYSRKTREDIKVNFWDVGGDAVYFEIRNEFYRDTHGAFLAFDVGDRKTFETIQKWIDEFKQFATQMPVLSLVGNKIDMPGRQVSRKEAEDAAQTIGAR